MRWRNCSVPLLSLSLFPLHTCKQQALTVRLWPWGSHSFPLEPAVSNNVCMLHLPKENYTFFLLDLQRESYLENIWYLYLLAAVIDFTASFSVWKRNPCTLLTFFQVSCGSVEGEHEGRRKESSVVPEPELGRNHFSAHRLESSL